MPLIFIRLFNYRAYERNKGLIMPVSNQKSVKSEKQLYMAIVTDKWKFQIKGISKN
jgi:hypothetical protein